MAVVVEGGLALVRGCSWPGFSACRCANNSAAGRAAGRAVVRGLVATLPMLVVFWWLVNSKWPMHAATSRASRMAGERNVPHGEHGCSSRWSQRWPASAKSCCFAAFCKRSCGDGQRPSSAWLIASLLFGLAHAMSKLYFAFAIVVGAFLGWLAWQYHDLTVAPMLAHGLYDFLALVYLSRSTSSRSSEDTITTSSERSDEPRPANDERINH